PALYRAWTRAARAPARIGAPAVGPVLAVLCDESSPVEWSDAAMVLREIGEPALGPLMDAAAAAATKEVARRVRWALGRLRVVDLSVLIPGLSHPSPLVRSGIACAF